MQQYKTVLGIRLREVKQLAPDQGAIPALSSSAWGPSSIASSPGEGTQLSISPAGLELLKDRDQGRFPSGSSEPDTAVGVPRASRTIC